MSFIGGNVRHMDAFDMNWVDIFEFASGSVIGRTHLYGGTSRRKVIANVNNQDAVRIWFTPTYFVAIVLDGCGSGQYSEVGANAGAALITAAFEQYLQYHAPLPIEDMLERIRLDTLAEIRSRANRMGPSLSWTISNYYLFTVVGVYVDRATTAVFSLGDGVAYVNGEMIAIGPFPNNAPPYMAYAITGSPLTNEHPELLDFHILEQMDTRDLDSLLIGTDGVMHLARAEHLTIPGREELVGPISQFWSEGHYFSNLFAVQRRLNLINRDHVVLDLESGGFREECGRLPDDTTLVVVRKKRGQSR